MLPVRTLLLGAAAGLIAAIVFASATTGPVLARFTLFLLTPLSLFLAGLGLGPRAAAVAGGTGMLAILALATPKAALMFGISQAIPAILLTHLAMLNQQSEDGPIWYPIGRLVVWTAALASLFVILAILSLGGDFDALTKALRTAIEEFVKTEISPLPNAPTLTPADFDQLTQTALYLLPGALAMMTMATILLNLWLAGRITKAAGHLARPWPDLSAMTFPNGVGLVLAAALLASFAGGTVGLAAAGAVGAFAFAFMLLGLAVIHYVTTDNAWRAFVLAFVYTTLAVFGVFPALIIAILGLFETVWTFRGRPRATAPPSA